MDKTLDFINICLDSAMKKVQFSRDTNTFLTIGFTGPEFEILTNLELGLKGTGAASGGSDHNDEAEGKGSNHIQPKDCMTGGKKKNIYTCIKTGKPFKVHPLEKRCPQCGRDKFFYHTDARWGISTSAHYKYKVPRYYGWVFIPFVQNSDNRKFRLQLFLIDSNNRHFNQILSIQHEFGKAKNKNFIPFSSDFYVSNPKMIANFEVDLSNKVQVLRLNPYEIIYDQEVLEIIKDFLPETFKNEKEIYTYEEIESLIDVKRKKTTHGKERGFTNRRNK